MKEEYERYKDLWGLNLHYSHSAGPTQNFSEYSDLTSTILFFTAKKNILDLQMVHIFFDTSTFDQVEKDVKVDKKQKMYQNELKSTSSGDACGTIGCHWWNDGPLYWLLYPQWH